MTDRASTLLSGRRERLERILERELKPPMTGPSSPMPPHIREFLCQEAEDLYTAFRGRMPTSGALLRKRGFVTG